MPQYKDHQWPITAPWSMQRATTLLHGVNTQGAFPH